LTKYTTVGLEHCHFVGCLLRFEYYGRRNAIVIEKLGIASGGGSGVRMRHDDLRIGWRLIVIGHAGDGLG